MQFEIATKVEQDFKQVWARFDENLFMELKPPLIPFKLLRFDGSNVGDEVHLSIAGMEWHAKVVEQKELDSEIYFIDEGAKLPFPLKQWQHRHRMLRNEDGTCTIIDVIEYFTSYRLLDKLIYPALYQQFAARQPIYRRYFSKS